MDKHRIPRRNARSQGECGLDNKPDYRDMCNLLTARRPESKHLFVNETEYATQHN